MTISSVECLGSKNYFNTNNLPKRSFGQGNIFTSVCQEFCLEGGT